jgi:hypothetical protein
LHGRASSSRWLGQAINRNTKAMTTSDKEYANAPTNASLENGAPSSADKALVMGPLAALLIALAAGVVSWAILKAILPVFQLPENLRNVAGNVSAELLQEARQATESVSNKNAALTLAVAASVLGLALTVGELLLRRSPLRAVWGGLLAAIVAGGLGIGAAIFGVAIMRSLEVENPLTKTMALQCAMLGVAGLGVGIAISLPILRPRLLVNCMVGGVLGGVLAGLVFPMAVSLLHKVNTEGLIPEGTGLPVWILLAYGLIGLTVAGLGKEKPKTSAKPSPT